MTKIYFACSITGGGDTSSYLDLINGIKAAGGEVISEIFAHDAINYGGSPLPAEEIYLRDIEMIHEADAVIAEVSNPSLGVGYELGYAEKIGRPVLGLYNTDSPKRLSAMISGNKNFQVENYTTNKLPLDAIETFIQKTLPELKKARWMSLDRSVHYVSPSAWDDIQESLNEEPKPNKKLLAALLKARQAGKDI